MISKDLRIRNYVSLSRETVLEVVEITTAYFYAKDKEGDNYKNSWAEIESISLTEEWLLNLGLHKEFCDTENIDAWYLDDFDDGFYISNNSNIYDGFYVGATTYGFLTSVESVHQLQNLYFALTGVELELIKNE